MSKGNDRGKWIVALLILAVLLISLSIFFIPEKPVNIKEFEVTFEVREEGIGLDINNTLLAFGALNPGGSSVREISIRNSRPYPVRAKIIVSDNLEGLIITETDYIVSSEEVKTIPVTLGLPVGFPIGNYTGNVRFEIYKSD